MKLRSSSCARAVGLAVGLACPALTALAADDVATVRFNNRSWNDAANWDHTNAALNGTVPNNTRENDYDVVVNRTVVLDIDVVVEKGLLDGGQISDSAANPNTLHFNDLFTFRNGFLQANTTAKLGILFDNATGNPFIERGRLTNMGVSTWTGGNVSPIVGGGIQNESTGMFYVRAASNLSYFSNDLTGFLNNQGTIKKLGPGRWDVRATFQNDGDVDVDEGEVRLVSVSGASRGRFNLAANTKLNLSSGNYTLRGDARVTGPGWFEVGQFANLQIGEPAQPASHVWVDNLLLNRGGMHLRGASTVYVLQSGDVDRAEIEGEGTLRVAPAANFRFDLRNGPMLVNRTVVENEGDTTVEGGGGNALTLQNDAWLSNKFGAVLNIRAPATLASTTAAAPGGVLNRGTLRMNATAGGGTVNLLDADLENHGAIALGPETQLAIFDAALEQLNGVMDVQRDASLVLFNAIVTFAGGIVKGEGTIQSNRPIPFGNVPGSTMRISMGQTPGKLTVQADVTMGDGAELFAELGGRTQVTEYDLLDVNGNAALDGDLLIDLIDGFENSIAPSDVFTVMTADSPLTGAFDNVASGSRVTGVDGFATFQVNYGPGSPFDANSVVLSNVEFIPEPATAAVMCLGGLMLTRRRR